MSKFLITRWVCGSDDEISISEDRFHRICAAKDGILLLTELEERLAVVLENFIEFEVAIFLHGLRWVVHEDWRWESRRDQVFSLNRHLLALLNAIWMYVDHADGELKRRNAVPKPLEIELTRKLKSLIESDALLATQLLRNYCQHQRFAFDGVGVTNAKYNLEKRIPPTPSEARVITSAVLKVNVADLRVKRKHSTRKPLDDLRSRGVAEWNPCPDLRAALDALTLFHTELREALSELFSCWTTELTTVLKEAESAFGQTLGLCVAERKSCGKYGEHVEVFSSLVDRVVELRSRNGDRTHLENAIVTSSVPIDAT